MQTPFGPPSDAIVETQWEGPARLFASPGTGQGPCSTHLRCPTGPTSSRREAWGGRILIASRRLAACARSSSPRGLVILRADHRQDLQAAQYVLRTGRRSRRAGGTIRPGAASNPGGGRERVQGSGSGVQSEVAGTSQPGPSLNPEPRTLNPESSFRVHGRGCYVCMEGPAFSTRRRA